MEANPQQDRQHAHALLDLVPPSKLGAVRNLLEVFLHEDIDTLSSSEAKAVAEPTSGISIPPHSTRTNPRRVRALHGRLGKNEPRALNRGQAYRMVRTSSS